MTKYEAMQEDIHILEGRIEHHATQLRSYLEELQEKVRELTDADEAYYTPSGEEATYLSIQDLADEVNEIEEAFETE